MRPPAFAVKFAAGRFEAAQKRAHASAASTQAKLLARTVRRYRDTELGGALGLEKVHSPADYRQHVRTRVAADYIPLWDRARAENAPGIVHPGRLDYMAFTSGTSGLNKLVPFPEEHLANFRTFTNHASFHAIHLLGAYDLMQGRVLLTSGRPIKEVTDNGLTIGFGSGLAAAKPSRMARALVLPSLETLSLADWRQKLDAMVTESLHEDVRMFTGMPNAVMPLLRTVVDRAREAGMDAHTAKDVWPNLRLWLYSGQSLEAHGPAILPLLGEGVRTFSVYSACEGPVGYQHTLDDDTLLLDLTTCVIELFEPGRPESRLGVDEAEPGAEYDVAITSPGGIFAYALGDRVQLVSRDPYVIRFLGRSAEEMSIVGERIPLASLRTRLAQAAADVGHPVVQWMVSPSRPVANAPLSYDFLVELAGGLPDETQRAAAERALATALDARLRSESAMYASQREGGVTLGPPTVRLLPPGTIDAYVLESRAFGQGKVVHVHTTPTQGEAILAFAAARVPSP